MTHNSYNDILSLFKSHYTTRFLADKIVDTRKAKIDTFQTLLRALSGDLPPAYYLCGMDCGGGKTTLIKDFLQVWKTCHLKPEGGVIIALHTLDQIEEFASDCGLSKNDYVVVTGSKRFNAFGCGRSNADTAPVLFTTQQMALLLLNVHSSFEKIEAYHFRGKPRRCRIWDESLDIAKPVVIPLDTLRTLPAALRAKATDFICELDTLLAEVYSVPERESSAVNVPMSLAHLSESVIMDFDRLNVSKEQAEVIRLLGIIAGRSATIERGIGGQMALIGSGYPLPADFAPVIVFDASTRLRETYNLQEKYHKNIIRLPSVVHDYQDTTIHLCKMAIGTSKLADTAFRGNILQKVASLIDDDPEHEYLVIHHMAKEGRYDIEKELDALVKDRERVSYVYWGNHCASNAYRLIRKVIVIGTWRKPDWVYGSMYMASSGEAYVEQGAQVRRAVRLGEHSHDLMQAVGRSNIRNVVEGRAGKVDVYLFASPEQGLEDRLQGVFPGCSIVPWTPIEADPKGHLAAAIAYLSAAFSGGRSAVTKAEVQGALGISASQGFRNVTKLDRFERFLSQSGIMAERYKFTKVEMLMGQSTKGKPRGLPCEDRVISTGPH